MARLWCNFWKKIKIKALYKYHMRQEIPYFTGKATESLERPLICKSFILESGYSSGVLQSQTAMLGRQIVIKIHN